MLSTNETCIGLENEGKERVDGRIVVDDKIGKEEVCTRIGAG